MNKRYTSFEQIDKDLRVLKLKREIDFACLKSNVSGFKTVFSIPNLIRESIEVLGLSIFAARGSFLKVIVGYLLKKFLLK